MSDPVISDIASAIHVRHIRTPIKDARHFTLASSVGDVLQYLRHFQFDATVVFPKGKEASAEACSPVGVLRAADLEDVHADKAVESEVVRLTGSVLIDGNASLAQLLARFAAGQRFLLVVGGQGLDGIVTPSDMNKQAGRTHLFMQLSALEMELSNRARTANRSDADNLDMLGGKRRKAVNSRLERNRESDQSADLVACLDFQDLLTIDRASSPEGCTSTLSDAQINGLRDFRNRVMHAVLEPTGDDEVRIDDLLEQTALVDALLSAP